MKDKIFVLLDELVSMSGSSYTTESLNLELDEISKKIDKIKDRIAKKKNTVYDNKYLNVSEQMVDRNLQISLEQRINSLQNSIDDLEANIQTSLGKEQNNYNKISHLEKEITEGEKLISAFTIKKQKSNNKEVKATYESLLEDQRTRLDEQQKEYDLAIKEKNEIAEELSYLSATNNEQIDNLKDTKDKLDKIRTKLSNEKNYYNYDEKQNDEEELSSLSKQIDKFESQRLDLLTNPANLASEAKKFIVQEDWNNAIGKMKELVTVLKTVPYINETDENILKKDYEDLKQQIDNKEKEIKNNTYATTENDVLESRIAYLTDVITNFVEKSDAIKGIVDDIDDKMILDLKNEIDNTEIEKKTVLDNLKELEDLVQIDDSVDLLASIASYKKELESIEKIIDSQTEELERLVDFSSKLENECVDRIEDRISKNKKTIKELEREVSLKAKLKDEKAILKDNEELDKLKSDLKLIENSMKFNKTPDELYSEIDVLMGSIDFDVPVVRERKKRKIEEPANTIEELSIEQPEDDGRIKVIEIIPVNPLKENKEVKTEKKVEEVPPLDTNPSDIGFNDLVDFIGGN